MKKARRSFAFGSSQRNRMTLMFGAAGFWRPGLSASCATGFRIAPRGIRRGVSSPMPHKCFKRRWIFGAARLRTTPWGLSASRGALFYPRQRAGARNLPSVCRNAPEVCRKTFRFATPAAGHQA
jgi:hypothetical protein